MAAPADLTALVHGLTVAEGKGGWLGTVVNTFPSTMAQNFWIAIFAWTTCMLVTVVVSMATRPRPDEELRGLVYSLTNIKHDEGVSWYLRPGPVAIVVAVLLLFLNFWFA